MNPTQFSPEALTAYLLQMTIVDERSVLDARGRCVVEYVYSDMVLESVEYDGTRDCDVH